MSGSPIVWRDFESPIGPMIGGASTEGICFLEWHDRGGIERILQRVSKRYGTEVAAGQSRRLDDLEHQLSAYFASAIEEFRVPVAVRGTPFEQEVWNLLRRIPRGETRSYSEIAALMGRPSAQRAVGRANGANYLSIVIPCHRVIEAGGGLRGYGGGLWRKRWLLELEGAIPRSDDGRATASAQPAFQR